jgi:23S rRNA pseudouridine2457 synthase
MKIDRMKNTKNNKYLLFYKPDGVICQFSEHEQHPSLVQFIPIKDIYPAGRLDTDSEGLLLLTNDGPLSHWLTDPKRHCPKVYYAQVEGDVSDEALKKLQRGVIVKGYQTLPCQVERIVSPELPPRQKPITPHALTSWIRITLHEGKKRQIRHMTAAVGFPTLRLIRVAIGPLNMKDLKPGQWRLMQNSEIMMLKTALRMTLAL